MPELIDINKILPAERRTILKLFTWGSVRVNNASDRVYELGICEKSYIMPWYRFDYVERYVPSTELKKYLRAYKSLSMINKLKYRWGIK